MASEVSICNNALVKLGSQTIISLTEDSKKGRLCNQLYPEMRDVILRSHIWKFAIKRKELAQAVGSPVYGWSYSYPLPSDYLRVIEPDIHDYPYKIEGNALLCHEGRVFLQYIYRVTDPNKMDVSFREALSARLAFEMSIPLADDKSNHQLFEKRYERALSEARMVGAMEDYPGRLECETWLRSRYTGVGGPRGVYEAGNE